MAVREVAFELECFEWADERLEVAGRWKGLGGRRLARPVLTVDVDGGRRKRLVAMPGGHFGAGAESWRAAFAWPGDPADITGAELEVGGNIVVDLPLPDRRRRRRKRPPVDPGDEALRAELGALRAQLERLRGELAGRERENMQLRAQLDEEAGDAGASTVEIERLAEQREEELTVELERLADERDRTRAELSAEIERLHGERERWKVEIDELREAFSDAAAEAEAARERHRAEIERLQDDLRAEREKPATREAAAAPPTQAMPAPAPATQSMPAPATQSMPAPPMQAMPAADDTTERLDDPPGTSTEPEPDPHPIVDAASLPGALDPPGPMRAAARPATQPGPAWGPSAGAFAAPDEEEQAADSTAESAPGAALRALKERLEHLFVPNGHATAEEDEEPSAPRPRRSAAAARARAGATVAARRSPAELWALRILAAALVAVLLIAFLLILTRIA